MAIPGPSKFERKILMELLKPDREVLSADLVNSPINDQAQHGLNITQQDLSQRYPGKSTTQPKARHNLQLALATLKKRQIIKRPINTRFFCAEGQSSVTPPVTPPIQPVNISPVNIQGVPNVSKG